MKVLAMALFLVLPCFASAEPEITKEVLKSISKELHQANLNHDAATIKKYIYPGSELVMITNPSSNRGRTEISYEDFMASLDKSFKVMKTANADIEKEIISIKIDKDKNQGTVKEKDVTILEASPGKKLKSVSVSTSVYGVVDGEIKALRTESVLKSQEIIN